MNGEEVDEQEPEPERRRGDAGQHEEGDDAVGPAELAHGGDHTCEKPDHRAQDQRYAGQHQRCLKPFQHLVEHGPVQREGPAEIALQHVADPDRVLLHQRLVESEVTIDALDVFRRRIGAENGRRRVARNESHDEKDDDGKPEQDGHHGNKPLQDIGLHG